MKKQNGTINLIKFLMAVGILLMHAGMEFGFDRFQGTWIFVEWFYIFAGYCVTKEVVKKSWPAAASAATPAAASAAMTGTTDGAPAKSADPGELTFGILKKRICAIYPYFFVACILGLVIQLLAGSLVIGSVSDAAPVAAEFLMLQMTGLNLANRGVIGTTWFLSAMWIALALIIPCIAKMKKYYVCVLSLLLALLIYGYLDVTTGYLWSPGSWAGFAAKGTLRAVAALSLGAFSYGLGERLRPALTRPKTESLLLYAAYALVFLFTWRYADSKWYYLIPLLFTVLVAVGMTKQPGWDVPDTKATRFLGKISMLLFINHVYNIYAIQKAFPQWSLPRKMFITLLAACVCMAVSYFGGEALKKLWHSKKNALK